MSRRVLLMAALATLLAAGATRANDAADPESRALPPRRSPPAAQRDIKTPGAGAAKKSGGGGWWSTLGGLVAVLALIYLAAKVVQKSVPAARKSLPSEVVQVLGRKPLDYRHTIHLVRFGSRLLMLGSSQDGITTLSEINDPVEIDYLAGLCQPSEPAAVSRTFQQLFRRFQNPEPAGIDSDADADRDDEPEATTGPAVLRLEERLQQLSKDADGQSTPSPEAVG
jgi:flagellar biogenesis protein FliO